ncbi:hypothetical protein ABT298_13780 [Streptomyces sp. NPDC001034]
MEASTCHLTYPVDIVFGADQVPVPALRVTAWTTGVPTLMLQPAHT